MNLFIYYLYLSLLRQTICWTAALTEVAVILATRNPKLPISQKIIAKLVFSGSADGIRPTPLFFLGIFMASVGGYIRYSCYRTLGKLFTFEMSIRDEHRLITHGPYRVVRHPAYTGVILTIIGIICWHSSSVRIVFTFRACHLFTFSARSSLLILGLMGQGMWNVGDQVWTECCFAIS